MADSSGKTATFTVKIAADGSQADKAAKDLDRLKVAIGGSKDKIEEYRIALRALKGTDDAVKASREALKAKIDLERDAIGRNNIAMRKAQTVLETLKKKTDAVKASTGDFAKAVGKVGGPVADATEKLSGFKEVLGLVTSPTVALGVAAAVAALGVTAAFIDGAVAVAKFVAESANALRAMGLMREAATGSAQNAYNLGTVIDSLSDKLATPKERLNELATGMARALGQSKVSGQGIEDTFEAVARASDAMGDATGAALQSIIDRGKLWGRTGIGRFELQPHGLKFEDVAGALAKNLKIGLQQAEYQLLTGTAKVDAVAKALKDSVNKRFGEVNSKKLLDLNVIFQKFHENLAGLAKNVNLEPVLKALKQTADLFSDTTSTGHSLMVAITAIGTALGVVAKDGTPLMVSAVEHLILGFIVAVNWTLKAVLAFYQLKDSLTAGRGEMAVLQTGLIIIAAAAGLTALAVLAVGAALGVVVGLAAAFVGSIGLAFYNLYTWVKKAIDFDWAGLGRQVIAGIEFGIQDSWSRLKNTVTDLAVKIRDTFKNALGIHSPSAVFAVQGRAIPAGVAVGVEAGTSAATDAVQGMAVATTTAAPIAQSGAAGASGVSGVSGGPQAPSQSFVFNISGTGSPEETAKVLQSPSVLDALTHAIEVANRTLGFPTQSPAGA
jgi:hypothetical protein